MDKNYNPFSEVSDQAIIEKLFTRLLTQKHAVTIWTKNQVVKFKTQVSVFAANNQKLSFDLTKETNATILLKGFESQQSNELFGSFFIDSVYYFFKSNCYEKPEGITFLVSVPKIIYKLQRRAFLRIPFIRQVAPALTLNDPIKPDHLLMYRMLDISVGGLAFAIPLADQAHFKSNQIVNDIRFKMRGIEVSINGEVRHVKQELNDKNEPILKIGIQFLNLPKQDEDLIAAYVVEESQRLFSELEY